MTTDNRKTAINLRAALPLIPLVVAVVMALLLPGVLERDDFYRWIAARPYDALLGGICLAGGISLSLAWAAIQFGVVHRLRAVHTADTLDRQEHLNRATINTIDVGIIAADDKGRVVQINQAMADLFGIRGTPVLGKADAGIYKMFDPDNGQAFEWFQSPLARALNGDEVHDVEIMFRPTPENPRVALCSAKPILSRKGRNLGALMAAQDITEMRRAQHNLERFAETMQRSGADLQKVAFIAAHNLQEPSRGITSYSQLLQMQYGKKLDDAANEYIGFIVSEATRLKSQLADLLQYLETGAELKSPTTVDLNPVFEEAREQLRGKMQQDRDYSVQVSGMPTVQGHAELLKTLLFHLLDNAIKFNKSSLPVVHISVTRNDEEQVFRFEDNGIGIAKSDAEKVFELFQTVHPIGTYPGTGLGLAICRKIVTLHGGRIWLENVKTGGTAVCFTLPHDIPTGVLE